MSLALPTNRTLELALHDLQVSGFSQLQRSQSIISPPQTAFDKLGNSESSILIYASYHLG